MRSIATGVLLLGVIMHSASGPLWSYPLAVEPASAQLEEPDLQPGASLSGAGAPPFICAKIFLSKSPDLAQGDVMALSNVSRLAQSEWGAVRLARFDFKQLDSDMKAWYEAEWKRIPTQEAQRTADDPEVRSLNLGHLERRVQGVASILARLFAQSDSETREALKGYIWPPSCAGGFASLNTGDSGFDPHVLDIYFSFEDVLESELERAGVVPPRD